MNKIKKIFMIIVKTLKLIWNSSKKYMIFLSIITIIGGILVPLNSIVWGYFIDEVTEALKGKNISNAIIWLLISIVMIYLISIIGSVKNYLLYIQAGYMNMYITETLTNKIEKVKASAFDNSNFYNNVQKTNNESVSRTIGIMNTFLKCIESLVSIISIIIIFINFDLWIIIICILSCIPVLAINLKIAKKQYEVYNLRFENLRYILSLKDIFTKYDVVKELKVYRIHRFISKKILRENKIFLNQDKKIRGKFAFENIIADGVRLLLSAFLKIAILYRTVIDKLMIGKFVAYIQLIDGFQVNISILFNVIQSFFEDGLYINDFYQFIEDRSIEEKEEQEEQGYILEDLKTIEFKNVSFKYPESDKWILKNINIKFNKGNFYALVGINGSGKTSLIKLILGLYEPTKGNIYVNGIEINLINKKQYFSMFATVFQDFIKYPFTVYENIGIGYVENMENLEQIEKSGRQSGIDEVIQRLATKYNTKLQKGWKDAAELSHGQWQRIALSRAFFNWKSEVVILDEPSSALDPEAESNILKKFEEVTENKMQIIISHRLSNIKKASCIFLLKNGEVISKGDHQELYKESSDYKKMYDMQAEGYVD